MNLADLLAQLESEKCWRQDEIRFFQNRGASLLRAEEQDQYRRAVVLVLYAHFEGFCKFALELYRNAINSEQIECRSANYAIVAASMANVFRDLRSPDSKCKEFKNALPDDAKLHRFARDREFVERTTAFGSTVVDIPDDVVDTESNLKPVVLRKNLYRLGLTHDQFSPYEGKINKLIQIRNSIAHGESASGVSSHAYEDLRRVVFEIMDEVSRHVIVSLREKRFLRTSPSVSPS
jgi:hypothetical protein